MPTSGIYILLNAKKGCLTNVGQPDIFTSDRYSSMPAARIYSDSAATSASVSIR